jgi:predicted RNA-binding Zn-ribbon protein involved in translation (DUF1610 family)
MSESANTRGLIYRCPVCGAEAAVLATRSGVLVPRCCDVVMDALGERMTFYVCPVCGSEIGVVQKGAGPFLPRCCDRSMARQAA